VRPERHGSLANHGKLPSSQRHGHGAGAKVKPRQRQERAANTGAGFRRGPAPERQLKRREGRRRLRRDLSWRSLHGSRERPAVAMMVANQASDAARTLGLDAVNRPDGIQFSQQPAKTRSRTGTTRNAWKPNVLGWDETDPGVLHRMLNGGKFRVTARTRTVAPAYEAQQRTLTPSVMCLRKCWLDT
jgi:hypothetical protein